MGNDLQPESSAGSDRLTSVDNALWLLQLVAQRQALRVSEAADLLGVARSTAHRLLSALRRRDFLMQDKPNGEVTTTGPALYAVGMSAISGLDIRRVSQPVLEELRDKTKETTSLAVLEGTMIRFIECYEGLSTVRIGDRTGVVRYAHATAAGQGDARRAVGRRASPALSRRGTARADAGLDIQPPRADGGDDLGSGGRGSALNWEESWTGSPRSRSRSAVPRGRRWRRSASRCRACGLAVSPASGRSHPTCSTPRS